MCPMVCHSTNCDHKYLLWICIFILLILFYYSLNVTIMTQHAKKHWVLWHDALFLQCWYIINVVFCMCTQVFSSERERSRGNGGRSHLGSCYKPDHRLLHHWRKWGRWAVRLYRLHWARWKHSDQCHRHAHILKETRLVKSIVESWRSVMSGHISSTFGILKSRLRCSFEVMPYSRSEVCRSR